MKKQNTKVIFYLVAFLLFFLYLKYGSTTVVEDGALKLIATDNKKMNRDNLRDVVVHFDLKGAPPKLDYLASLFPMLKRLGVTAILMEYEDMFPYNDDLEKLSASNSYNSTELKNYLVKALGEGLEIIPLIQTFGHMEHVLKLKEFKYLREAPNYPDSICPSKVQSTKLIKKMLTQVIDFHTSVAPLKYFHVGCDEVYHINKCSQCLQRKMKNIEIFSKHVDQVTNMVKMLSPDTKVLIWDDMFRELNKSQWDNLIVSESIQPVYWDYSSTLKWTSDQNIRNLQRKFENIWVASAFKGADGRASTLPNLSNRYQNHLNWMGFLTNYSNSHEYNFKGIILTGWARYNHLSPLCDILPAALPSLILNLLLIKTVKEGAYVNWPYIDINKYLKTNLENKLNGELNCNYSITVEDLDNLRSCFSESVILYNIFREIYFIDVEIKSISGKDRDRCINAIKNMLLKEAKLRIILHRFYDSDVIEELFKYKILPLKSTLFNKCKIKR